MELRLPELSGTKDEIVLTLWRVKESEYVMEGQDILEVVTDKATFDIPAPCGGKLVGIRKKEGERASVNEILAEIMET